MIVRSTPTLVLLLLFLTTASLPQDDRSKSLALKHASVPQTAYGFKYDNSAARYWDEFMLVRNANAGDPLAQHELGLRYLTRNGFPADTPKAAYWIQKAAAQKLTTARYNYGLLLNNGWGVAWNCVAKDYVIQNPSGAVNWMIGCLGVNRVLPRPFGSGPNLPEGIIDSPGVPVAPQVERLSRPLVVGLYASPERIVQIRENRLLSLKAHRDDDRRTFPATLPMSFEGSSGMWQSAHCCDLGG